MHARRTRRVVLPAWGPLQQAISTALNDGPAELPRVYIDTTYSLPAGNVWTATNTSDNNAAGTGTGNRTGCGFQYALNNCALGDVIQLTNGAVYTGKFNCPNKGAGSQWIYVMPSDASFLPAPTTSLSAISSPLVPATHFASMPVIQHPATVNYDFEPALGCSGGAHHFRFVGIEFRPTYTEGRLLPSLVWLGRNSSTGNRWSDPAQLPHNFTFDRCYIHGYADYHVTCGLRLDGNYMAAVDCYFDELKNGVQDNQTINVINGYGPFRISNNRLRSTGEVIIFGGAGIPITNLLPADIHIFNNEFSWDPAWEDQAISYWNESVMETRNLILKNLLEFKTGDRVLIERNRFRDCWTNPGHSTQQGQGIYIVDGDESAPDWSTSRNVTVRYNDVRRVGSGFMVASNQYLQPDITPPKKISCHDNVFEVEDRGTFFSSGWRFTSNQLDDYLFEHNTVVLTKTDSNYQTSLYDIDAVITNCTVRNNIFVGEKAFRQSTGGRSPLSDPFGDCWPGGSVLNNVFVSKVASGESGDPAWVMPATNTYDRSASFPANVSTIGFVDFVNGNYRLDAGSAFKNAGTDGKDLGADLDLVAA